MSNDHTDKVEIVSDRSGAGTTIKLNGKEIQSVTALDLRLRPDEVNQLTLGIDFFLGVVEADVEVQLLPEAVEILKTLGWTKPE